MDSSVKTLRHIARVRQLLGEFAAEMIRRGDVHDASKFDPEEKGPLDEMERLIAEEGNAPYGSEEYKRRTELLAPMLAHHYVCNSHHPEHHQFEYGGDCMHGINGMTLFDLVEMFFDWKAASERGEESALGLSHSIERFNIDSQLANILRNTAQRLGYRVQ